MQANYDGSISNSSWLTHVATLPVTHSADPQKAEVATVVFTQGVMR